MAIPPLYQIGGSGLSRSPSASGACAAADAPEQTRYIADQTSWSGSLGFSSRAIRKWSAAAATVPLRSLAIPRAQWLQLLLGSRARAMAASAKAGSKSEASAEARTAALIDRHVIG